MAHDKQEDHQEPGYFRERPKQSLIGDVISPNRRLPSSTGITTIQITRHNSSPDENSINLTRRISSVAQIRGLSPHVVGWLRSTGVDMPNRQSHIIPTTGDFQYAGPKPVDEEEVDELGEVLSKPVFGPALQNALKALNDVCVGADGVLS